MNTIDDIICRNFRCPDQECPHHKTVVMNYMYENGDGFGGNFLFKVADKNKFYDCSMGYFKISTYAYLYEDIKDPQESKLLNEQIKEGSIIDATRFNFKYGPSQEAIDEFLKERKEREK